MVFIMTLVVGFLLMAYLMGDALACGLYMVPFTIVAILMVVFFDGRTAFFVYITEVMLCTLVSAFPLEFIYVQLIAGIAAICSLKGAYPAFAACAFGTCDIRLPTAWPM